MKTLGTKKIMFGILLGCVAGLAATTYCLGAPEITEDQLVGPFRHQNLEVYLIQAAPNAETLPENVSILTLEEGLASGDVVVTETGNVNNLKIENKSDHHVYVHSGDILKGGKQDRAIPNGFTLAPKSGPVEVSAFCVEQGRWSQRGNEAVGKFTSSVAVLNSNNLKQAAQIGKSQQLVWTNVGRVQAGAAVNAGNVMAAGSPTSLQLTLESPNYQKATRAYVSAITSQMTDEQLDAADGFVYALHGKFRSSDRFASKALFAKMWPKLLDAMASEAVAEFQQDAKSLPLAKADFIAALKEPAGAKPETEKLAGGNAITIRQGEETIIFGNVGTIDGALTQIHRNVAAKVDFANGGMLAAVAGAGNGSIGIGGTINLSGNDIRIPQNGAINVGRVNSGDITGNDRETFAQIGHGGGGAMVGQSGRIVLAPVASIDATGYSIQVGADGTVTFVAREGMVFEVTPPQSDDADAEAPETPVVTSGSIRLRPE